MESKLPERASVYNS